MRYLVMLAILFFISGCSHQSRQASTQESTVPKRLTQEQIDKPVGNQIAICNAVVFLDSLASETFVSTPMFIVMGDTLFILHHMPKAITTIIETDSD